ncbi:hypothetical protein CsatB_012798 [Cannabis sativa]
MESSIGVLMPIPIYEGLQRELKKRFKVYNLWEAPNKSQFINTHASSIRAYIGTSGFGADADFINALPNLEIIASFSAGTDLIDLELCKEKGIRVSNTPDVLTDDVADIGVGLILGVLRRLCDADRYVRSGGWKSIGDYNLTTKLSGKTVGIIGLGRIGEAIAKRVEGFNCPIIYHSRSEKAGVKYKYYPNVVELAANCQILVVACSLTPDNHNIVNRRVIDALGPKGVVINIGRGAHVDEGELVHALVEGRLGGAGLDVYQNEPNVPPQLLELDNVLLLHHVGSSTFETRISMTDLVIANLDAHFFNNKPLLTPVV